VGSPSAFSLFNFHISLCIEKRSRKLFFVFRFHFNRRFFWFVGRVVCAGGLKAVAGLRGLAAHPTVRVLLLRENVLEPLMMAAMAPSQGGAVEPRKAVEKEQAAGDSPSKSPTAKGGGSKSKAGVGAAVLGDGSKVMAEAEAEGAVDQEVQREVAAALCNLTNSEENKVLNE
jgi:hypothetical protein